MVTEGTRPQNNLSEAGKRLKSHKNRHTSHIQLPDSLSSMYEPPQNTSLLFTDLYRHLVWLYRPPEQSTKSRPDKLKVSLIWKLLPDSTATSCWCYLTFDFCAHMFDFAKSSHKYSTKNNADSITTRKHNLSLLIILLNACTGSWHGDFGQLTAAPDTCLNTDKTKIWAQKITRQVSSRPVDGHSWLPIFSWPLESWVWCWSLYRITYLFTSSAQTGVIIIHLCLYSPASRTAVHRPCSFPKH